MGLTSGRSQQRYSQHLGHDDVGKGLKQGVLLKTIIRFNAQDRQQAFATIEGLPSDLMIRGHVCQNRAVEGDEVALEILPLSRWFIIGSMLEKAKEHPSAAPDSSSPSCSSQPEPIQQLPPDSGAACSSSPSLCASPLGAVTLPMINGSPLGTSPAENGASSQGWWQSGQQRPQQQQNELLSNSGVGSRAAVACVTPCAAARTEAALQQSSAEQGPQRKRNSGKGRRGSKPSSGQSALIEQARQQLETSFGSSSSSSSSTPWELTQSSVQTIEIIAGLLTQRPELRACARVVAILQPSRKRGAVVGLVREDPFGKALMLMPCDPRMPMCLLRSSELPAELKASLKAECKKDTGSKTLVSGHIVGWEASAAFPLAQLRASLGQAGELATEMQALLQMESVKDTEFEPEVLACLPATPWSISEAEISMRRDLRSSRIFSIDPPTARDLDDALSIEALPGGTFRVGVHIADVAFFVPPGSALDAEARERGTSVYLVDRVIPMLPRLLCEQLCSLNAGVDRLTFSVIWEMTADGRILQQWCGRTVISSCAKLAYGHAQDMIEGSFDASRPPMPLTAPHTWSQVQEDVLALHGIAAKLRAGRFGSGALRLDNTKLNFSLDADGNPEDAHPHVQREANKLVEEFMLLANMSVAALIADAFPERALLRRHPPPNQRKLEEVSNLSNSLGVQLDASSAGALHESLQALKHHKDADLIEIMQLLVTKPMQVARYFCTGDIEVREDWRHYALAVPEYTHFTSPIRRYPDLVVHRLLAAALARGYAHHKLTQTGHAASDDVAASQEVSVAAAPDEALGDDEPNEEWCKLHGLLDAQTCGDVAKHCNDTKQAAKLVQETSMRLFLCALLARRPVVAQGIVTSLNGQRFFHLYVPELGLELRIESEDMQPAPVVTDWNKDARTLYISLPRGDRPASFDPSQPNAQVTKGINNLEHLKNAKGLQPVTMPLQLKMFSRVPVIVSALQYQTDGKPNAPFGRLYIAA